MRKCIDKQQAISEAMKEIENVNNSPTILFYNEAEQQKGLLSKLIQGLKDLASNKQSPFESVILQSLKQVNRQREELQAKYGVYDDWIAILNRLQYYHRLNDDSFVCQCCGGTGMHKDPVRIDGKLDTETRDCETCDGLGKLAP